MTERARERQRGTRETERARESQRETDRNRETKRDRQKQSDEIPANHKKRFIDVYKQFLLISYFLNATLNNFTFFVYHRVSKKSFHSILN